MQIPGQVMLQGRIVRLEPLTLEHVPALFAAGNHPELWRYYTRPMANVEGMRYYVEAALKAQEEGLALPFVQVECAGGTVVGSTRYGNIDVPNYKLEIGWTWLDPAWQRSGVNTEAKLLLLTHAFETLGCLRVELKSDARNEKSRRAMERIGAQYEGTLRQHMRLGDGHQRDSSYYSVIAEEWPETKTRIEGLLR